VTSIVVVPVASSASTKFLNYCWTSSLDGMLFYWDFSAPDLLKKVNVQLPVHSMVVCPPSNSLKMGLFFFFPSFSVHAKKKKNFIGTLKV
jgi:hypothetical protein